MNASSTGIEQTTFTNNTATNTGSIIFIEGNDTAGTNTTIEPASNGTSLFTKVFNFIYTTLTSNTYSDNNYSLLHNIIYKVANELVYRAIFGTVDNFIIRAVYDAVFEYAFNTVYNLVIKTVTTPKYNYTVLNYSYIIASAIVDNSENGATINYTGEFNTEYNWWGTNTPTKNLIYSKTEGQQAPKNWVILDLTTKNNTAIATLNKIENNIGEIDEIPSNYKIPERTVTFSGENILFENQTLQITNGLATNPYTEPEGNYTIEILVDNQKINMETLIYPPETPETPETPEVPETPETPITPEPKENTITSNIKVNNLNKTFNSEETLKGTLLDTEGNAIIGHHIFIKLTRLSNNQSKTYEAVSDYKGEYTLPINLAAGSYFAEVKYEGITLNNKTYLSSISSSNITITNNNEIKTSFTLEKYNEAYGESKNFTGYLLDNTGKAIIGHHITIQLKRLTNGQSKTYYATTDYLGEFKLPINLARGEYSVICAYEGMNYYEGTSSEATITVY